MPEGIEARENRMQVLREGVLYVTRDRHGHQALSLARWLRKRSLEDFLLHTVKNPEPPEDIAQTIDEKIGGGVVVFDEFGGLNSPDIIRALCHRRQQIRRQGTQQRGELLMTVLYRSTRPHEEAFRSLLNTGQLSALLRMPETLCDLIPYYDAFASLAHSISEGVPLDPHSLAFLDRQSQSASLEIFTEPGYLVSKSLKNWVTHVR